MKKRRLLFVFLGVLLISLAAMASTAGALDPSKLADSTRYKKVTDMHDLLSLQAPLDWKETESGPWVVQGKEVGVYIAASPDLNAFYNSDTTPGVFFAASRDLAGTQRVANPALDLNPAILRMLNSEKGLRLKKCRDGGRFDYQDPFYKGQYDLFQSCGDGSSRVQALVSMPADQEVLLYLVIKTVSSADDEAAGQIIKTYQVLNNSLADDHHDDEH